jgi:polysaccharide biosynthesis transport protein
VIAMTTNSPPNPEASDTGSRHIDIFDILRRQWLKIVGGTALGVLAAFLYCSYTPPIHESVAEILILTKEAGLASNTKTATDNSVGFDYAMQNEILATHLYIVSSPAIVRKAITDNKLADFESIRSELPEEIVKTGDNEQIHRAVDGYIRENMVVEKAGGKETAGAQVMRVAFRHGSAEDGAKVLSAIVSTYEAFVSEVVQRFGSEAITLISKERDELEAQVQLRDRQYADFVRQSPLQAQFGETINPHAVRVAELEAELSRLQIEQNNTRSRLALVEKASEEGVSSFDELSMIDADDVARLNLLIEVDRNVPTAPVVAEYARMRALESEKASYIARVGANHPRMGQLQSQLDEIKASLSDKMTSLESIKNDDGINPNRLLAGYLELLRNDLVDFQRTEEAVKDQIKKEMEQSRVLVETELQQRRFYRQLERAESAYDVAVDRIGELDLLSNYAGFANAVLTPVEPGNQVWPRVPLLLLAGGLFGGLLGTCFGFGSEVLDRSYRSPSDVEDTLSVPVLCHLPKIKRHRTSGDSTIDPTVFAFHRPDSLESEAIRKLRGTLFYKTNNVDRPIVQITSPGQGEGKSTLATNLAVSTAQSRRRVLLIDCDFRSQPSANLLGQEFEVGVTDVLAGKANAEDAIHATSIPGLSVVPSGSTMEHASELLTLPEFRHFIKQVSEDFDFIFIDSPPVLDFSDTMAIADASDFVILALSLSRNARYESQDALAHLRSQGCNVLGIVINEFGKTSSSSNNRLTRRMDQVTY